VKHESVAPKQRTGGRSARVVAAVFDATLRELARSGYARLSIEAVAERAGVHKTTIYRRWPTVQELVSAALKSRIDALEQEELPVAPRDAIVAFLRAFIRSASTPVGRGVFSLVMREGLDGELAAIVRPLRLRRRERLRSLLRAARCSGTLRPGVDEDTALDVLLGAVQHRLLYRREALDEGSIVAIVDLLVAG